VLAGIHWRAPISARPVFSRTYDKCTVLIPFAFRGLSDPAAMLAGCLFLLAGCLFLLAGAAITLAAIETASAAAFLAGGAVAGAGIFLFRRRSLPRGPAQRHKQCRTADTQGRGR
jgi:hypothetical protein